MKALVINAPYEFSYEEREIKKCNKDDVLVKVNAVCICGSDAGAIRGTHGMFTYPRVMGHEVSGVVYEIGSEVTEFKVGDKVCLMPCVSCKKCKACKKGKPNACEELNIIGVHRDGGLEEYLLVNKENLLKIDMDITPEEIAMIEPLTIGAHAVSKVNLEKGDKVLVIGAGPIGVSCAVNAMSYGASVILSDTSLDRKKYVEEVFGLKVLMVNDEAYEEELKEFTDNLMFDSVIDTTAYAPSMENTWKYICNGGKIVFVGIAGGQLSINGPGFHSHETELYVSRNSNKEDYDRVLSLIKDGKIKPMNFVSHRVKFDEAGDVLASWIDPKNKVFKGVVVF